jgi:hypothetical protein
VHGADVSESSQNLAGVMVHPVPGDQLVTAQQRGRGAVAGQAEGEEERPRSQPRPARSGFGNLKSLGAFTCFSCVRNRRGDYHEDLP